MDVERLCPSCGGETIPRDGLWRCPECGAEWPKSLTRRVRVDSEGRTV